MAHRADHVVVLLLLLAVVMAQAPVEARSAQIPLVLDMDGRITLMVRVNGAGPFRFRLDTGASGTVIAARVSAALGLAAAGRSRTVTHAGEAWRSTVRLDEVALANGLAVPDVAALVVADRDLDRTGAIEGLLGQDVLSHWPYTIDYTAGRLSLSDIREASSRAVRLPLSRVSGGLVATVSPSRGGSALRLVPDSGADRTVLFRSAGDALPPLTILDTLRVRSIAGDRVARLVRVHGLEVGGIRLPDHEGLLMERGPAGDAMGDGLLPLHLFSRVSFDVGAGFLVLVARQ